MGLEIRSLDTKFANRVKKIILSNKEICYLNSTVVDGKKDLLALGSYGIFKELAKEIIAIGNEDIGFKITRVIHNITDYENSELIIGKNKFTLNKAHVMGILNVTPDSFSDGGKYFSKDFAVNHGLDLLEKGAAFLDIGGESSRPGAENISIDEELRRVIPVIGEILIKKPNAIISIDTTKPKVAEEALSLGAKIVNDISSFNDPKILDVVKKHNAALVLMHMKGNPKSMQDNPIYEDVVSDIYDYLIDKSEQAKKVGIKNVIIDPGIGFGKRIFDNFELIKRLNEFKGIGCPIMIGLSRKSFLGRALNLPIEKRGEATIIAETIAIKNGSRIIRTHNVTNAIHASKINNYIENPESLTNV